MGSGAFGDIPVLPTTTASCSQPCYARERITHADAPVILDASKHPPEDAGMQ